MKFERISENQIRCTLNKNDLIEREIKISELAYGSEKTKALFKEMMDQASEELGFEVEDIPLIIEAIPLSGDCIVLTITKVADPEELDTRFSRFSSAFSDDPESYETDEDIDETDEDADYTGADEIINLFQQIKENLFPGLESQMNMAKPDQADDDQPVSDEVIQDASGSTSEESPMNIIRVFSFHSLDDISDFAASLHGAYPAASKVYKQPSTGNYFLVMEKGEQTPESFNRICNIATEYGKREKFTYATTAYYAEHYDTIIKKDALMVLAELI